MSVQHSSPKIEDIAIPETVEVAIMQWWNSPERQLMREDEDADAYMFAVISAIKVALLSLATNPVVPPEDVVDSLTPIDKGFIKRSIRNDVACACTEWQRRMFLKRVPEVPAEIKALLWVSDPDLSGTIAQRHDADVLAAFKAGLEKRDAGN